jgi:hypothetical protein
MNTPPFSQTFVGAIVVTVVASLIVLLVQKLYFEEGKALVTAPTTAALPSGLASQASMSGTWIGQYSHRGGEWVPFKFSFDSSCTGRAAEPNTFGRDARARKLYADLTCYPLKITPGARVRITKQYDGTGQVSHMVSYEGIVSDDLKKITGKWRIGTETGPFVLER